MDRITCNAHAPPHCWSNPQGKNPTCDNLDPPQNRQTITAFFLRSSGQTWKWCHVHPRMRECARLVATASETHPQWGKALKAHMALPTSITKKRPRISAFYSLIIAGPRHAKIVSMRCHKDTRGIDVTFSPLHHPGGEKHCIWHEFAWTEVKIFIIDLQCPLIVQ